MPLKYPRGVLEDDTASKPERSVLEGQEGLMATRLWQAHVKT
jgi:hypothetical protein